MCADCKMQAPIGGVWVGCGCLVDGGWWVSVRAGIYYTGLRSQALVSVVLHRKEGDA